ncbi:hypothetical protein RB195_019471 [Necator americanus]|uniref:Uncharacterized protein n=1 Tax=Necator americanus TaxID=51031 RepID=A0ABR1CEB8_NECAM
MLIDADEFYQDVLDTSYGYASNNHMRKTKPKNHAEDANCGVESDEGSTQVNLFLITVKCVRSDGRNLSKISESLHSISSKSFLRTELNSSLPENFAVEVAVRAGCSSDAVEMARNFEDGLTGIDDLLPKMSENDAALLSAQLDREIKSEWKSSSLLGRLGVDEPGLAPCDSILRMYDLLCNINFQLLVMQRELLKHESVVREVRGTKDATACGFEDINNKAQLGRLIHSLDISSASLRDRIESLSRALFEDTWKPEKKTNELSYYALPACFAVLTLGWLIVRMNVVGIK